MSLLNSLRKATYEYPFAVWGVALGVSGPLLVLIGTPIREALGYKGHLAYPEAYPLPKRARRPTVGFEDEAQS
ncbi:n19m, NADH-ubiquinone oxidoreductase 9.5 kDa subunit [Coemansia spiralis]|nr:n19m, NADH-ubiquinone oxidoreductase 9.5 kDa subunit [Coemansia spiralis]